MIQLMIWMKMVHDGLAFHIDVIEICDGLDNNCDGQFDEDSAIDPMSIMKTTIVMV